MIFINSGKNSVQIYLHLYVSNIIGGQIKGYLVRVIKMYLPLFHNLNP